MQHNLLLLILFLMLSCRGTKTNGSKISSATSEGEVEITVPCSGPEFFTDSKVFRANSLGESIDMSISKRKAMTNARSQLASNIQTTVKTVTDNYVNSSENNNQESLGERFESLNREVVSQELRGIRVICERYFKTPEGKYKTYVAIELSAQQLVEAYHQRIATSQAAPIDFDKFKKTLEEEMAKSGKE